MNIKMNMITCITYLNNVDIWPHFFKLVRVYTQRICVNSFKLCLYICTGVSVGLSLIDLLTDDI